MTKVLAPLVFHRITLTLRGTLSSAGRINTKSTREGHTRRESRLMEDTADVSWGSL